MSSYGRGGGGRSGGGRNYGRGYGGNYERGYGYRRGYGGKYNDYYGSGGALLPILYGTGIALALGTGLAATGGGYDTTVINNYY